MVGKLLIVDNNIGIQEMLFKMKEFEVKVANDGQKGLQLIKNENFDAIILDLTIDLAGFKIMDELEKLEMTKNEKLILLTSTRVPTEK